ncbi:MAG: hypothetical protein HN509_00915, partial [Halobacteriovoraceae bacterium]|nr:hypothetical protein [Halobacteriovoraceae bacterium]
VAPYCDSSCDSNSCLYLVKIDRNTGEEKIICERNRNKNNKTSFKIKNENEKIQSRLFLLARKNIKNSFLELFPDYQMSEQNRVRFIRISRKNFKKSEDESCRYFSKRRALRFSVTLNNKIAEEKVRKKVRLLRRKRRSRWYRFHLPGEVADVELKIHKIEYRKSCHRGVSKKQNKKKKKCQWKKIPKGFCVPLRVELKIQ